ncbi:MAG: glycosyltransferase family 4 protein [Bacteroidia bacterium]
MKPVKLIRITTAPISLRLLITGQPEYMQDSGFEVILISADGKDWELMPNLHNFEHYRIDLARPISIKDDLKALPQLIKLFRKLKPDIVHSHTPKAGLMAMLAAKICGVPIRIHTLAGMRLNTTTGLMRQLLMWTEKITYACSHEVWPNSKELSKIIIQEKMIDPEKVHMILNGSSNGIDLSRYSLQNLSAERIEHLKRQWKISNEDFVFLAVGRVVHDKGIDELVNAFSVINNKYPNTKLFILGPFEDEDAVSDTAKNLIQSHPGINHINWSNEVEYFMAIAQCFIHASHREGFPNVVLQAGAMNCPIICSNIPGNIDIVENQEEGNVYPVKDKDALISNMEWVLNNYSQAKIKANKLKEKIYNNFDRRAVFSAIKQRYVQLLKSKNIDVSGIR